MNFKLSVFFILISNVILALFDLIIINDDIIYNYLLSKGNSEEVVIKAVKTQNTIRFLTPFVLTLSELIKVLCTSIILNVVLILFDFKLSFLKLYTFTASSRLILFIPKIYKGIWFSFVNDMYDLKKYESFELVTIFQIIDRKNIDVFWIYPLSFIDIFQLLFLLALSFQINKVLNGNFNISLGLTSVAYICGILFWFIIISFISIF